MIALVGDHDPAVTAHGAIPLALERAAVESGRPLRWEWVGTETVGSRADARLASFDGIWCVPATPYKSTEGALAAVRFARESGRPFLGTCGGFQHALVEYARGVWGIAAGHAELDPKVADPLIAPLTCPLVEATGAVRLEPTSRLRAIYGCLEAEEGYHCRYGLAPEHAARLASGALRVAARDDAGEVRAVELDGHPFFVATLFQPERAALAGRSHPLIAAFVARCRTSRPGRGEDPVPS